MEYWESIKFELLAIISLLRFLVIKLCSMRLNKQNYAYSHVFLCG